MVPWPLAPSVVDVCPRGGNRLLPNFGNLTAGARRIVARRPAVCGKFLRPRDLPCLIPYLALVTPEQWTTDRSCQGKRAS